MLAACLTVSGPRSLAVANAPERTTLNTSFMFVENRGQMPEEVLFYTLGTHLHLWVTADALWYSKILREQPDSPVFGISGNQRNSRLNVRLEFIQRGGPVRVEPFDPRQMRFSSYQGRTDRDQSENLPVWGGLRIGGLHPFGVLEIGAEAGRLRMELRGADGRVVPWNETLFNLRGAAPPRPGQSGPAPAALGATPALKGVVRYSTFLGGTLWDEAEAIAVDSQGRIYLGGHTQSLDFPSTPGVSALEHNVDAFLVRLDPEGATTDYLTVIQGGDLQNGEEYITAIALDPAGNAVAAGRTDSLDFPTTPGSYDTTFNGAIDGFILKLEDDGTLAYSSLLGGADTDWPAGLAVAADGTAHLTGGTWSTDFPATTGALDESHNGERDLFYAALAPAGDALTYATFIGGSDQEQAEDLMLAGDQVILTGWTRSDDFPVSAGAFQETFGGLFDAFALQLAPQNSSLIFSTYAGGLADDRGLGASLTPGGAILISGQTTSNDFPIMGGSFDTTFGGGTCGVSPCPDGFVLSLSPDGSQLLTSTFLGGAGHDQVLDISLDPLGNIYLTGETQSPEFPVSLDAFAPLLGGGQDAFLAVFEPSLAALAFSSFLGASNWESGDALVLDPDGDVWIAGKTRSPDFPVSPNAFANLLSGDYDAFATLLDLDTLTLQHLPIGLHQP